MKKRIFVALAVLTGSVAFAQKKVKQPPPPPPVIDAKEFRPPPPPPKKMAPPIVKSVDGKDSYSAFLKRNPGVKGISWKKGNIVVIRLKSGQEEMYNLSKEDDALNFRNKYGALPAPPPPPPSAPFPPPKVQKKGTLS